MILRKTFHLTFLLLFIASTLCGQGQESWFFSKDDIQNIQSSAHTSWGKTIIESLKSQINEREKHSLAVPKEEAGHLHDYFCPVHNVFFDFNWDNPTAHYCSFCDKTWSNDRINWAWIAELNDRNKQYLVNCMYVYLATGEKKYANAIKNMLLDYADKYPGYKVHDKGRNTTQPGNYSAKMYAQSLDEAVWFSDVCRAYSVVKPVLKKNEITKIETRLLREAANLLLQRGGGGNWQVWNNSGLAALGVALNDREIVKTAIDDKKVGYRHMMQTHVNKDGWWNEGSPNYHFYPLRAMQLTADAVRCMGYDLIDIQLEKMFTAPVKGVYNDLSFPSHNDGWYGVSLPTQINLYEVAYARFKNPILLNTLQACYNVEDRLSPDALLTNTTINHDKRLRESESHLFGHTGYGVLRSGERTVVLKYGPSGGGHGHPDKLSISIHNGKNEILPDLGTSAYGIPSYLKWYKTTLAHNTVTVDFKDQKPATGQLVYFEPTSMEAFTDKAYPGVDMTRRLYLDDNSLRDEFECKSDDIHTYDYMLLFTQQPQIQGVFAEATLNEGVPYQQIKEVKKTTLSKEFSVRTPAAIVTITVDGVSSFEVFTGQAVGVPSTNPSIVTKTGTERRPVETCYPVIIRTKDRNMRIKTNWKLL